MPIFNKIIAYLKKKKKKKRKNIFTFIHGCRFESSEGGGGKAIDSVNRVDKIQEIKVKLSAVYVKLK